MGISRRNMRNYFIRAAIWIQPIASTPVNLYNSTAYQPSRNSITTKWLELARRHEHQQTCVLWRCFVFMQRVIPVNVVAHFTRAIQIIAPVTCVVVDNPFCSETPRIGIESNGVLWAIETISVEDQLSRSQDGLINFVAHKLASMGRSYVAYTRSSLWC